MYETKEERDALFSYTGKYTELELLNKEATGFGWAVLVKDTLEDDRIKVVKLPNREAATRELLVEAKILSKIAQHLRHKNLVQLFSVERAYLDWQSQRQERCFLVLEFGGENLRRRLGRLGMRTRNGKDEYAYQGGKPLSIDEVLQIGIQAADGLAALHGFEEAPGQHIIHRDIKPENILIDKAGVVRLTDFGISKIVEKITQSISVAGTAPYLAPEYSRGRITAASDIYALGIVLYEMATGRFPFTFPDDRFYEMPEAPHSLNPDIPASLSDTIMQALWWDPRAERGHEEAQRYRRAADLLRDLRRCHGKLHPIPAHYVRREERDTHPNLYRDQQTQEDVRIYLYETEHPSRCLSKLASTVALKEEGLLTPQHTFDSEGVAGVVAPVSPRTPLIEPGTQEPVVAGHNVPTFLQQFIALARKVESLHQLGIYHGFLTPHNVYWSGESWLIDQVWLGPLIGTTSAESVLRRTDVEAGYLAPEILLWETPPTARSDIYGLGAILHGCFTGKPPVDSAAATARTQGVQVPHFGGSSPLPARIPTLSRSLQSIMNRALQVEPGDRYHSISEMIEELTAIRWPEDQVATLIEDAREYGQQGKLVEAYDALAEALRLDPGNPDVYHVRAGIYFSDGFFERALKENFRSLDIESTSERCFLQGRCLHALERYDEAIEFYEMGLEIEDCSRGRHLLGLSLQTVGQRRKALVQYQEALRLATEAERDEQQAKKIESDISRLSSGEQGVR